MSSFRILIVFVALSFAVVGHASSPVFEQVLSITNSASASGEIQLVSLNDDRDLLVATTWESGWKMRVIRGEQAIELPSAFKDSMPWFTGYKISQRSADGYVYVCGLTTIGEKRYPAVWKVSLSGDVTMTQLDGIAPSEGFVPWAVNSGGVVVGQTTNSVAETIEFRPPYSTYIHTTNGAPNGLLDNGARISFFERYNDGGTNVTSGAWTSSDGTVIRIPPTPNGPSYGIVPFALRGDWVVGGTPFAIRQRAFAWQPNLRRAINLPDPPNLLYSPSSVALSVNSSGDAVGLLGGVYPTDINGDLVYWRREASGYVAYLFQSLLGPGRWVPQVQQAFINNRGDVAVSCPGYPHPTEVRVYSRVQDGFVGLVGEPASVSEEDGVANFTVEFARATENTNTVRVNFETVGASAARYRPTSGTLVWSPGESGSKTISVPLIDNVTVDPDTTFEVRLSGLEGARFGLRSTMPCTIHERYQRVNLVNLLSISSPLQVAAVRSGAKSAVVLVERAGANDGELTLSGMYASSPAQTDPLPDVSWMPGEWGRQRIVVPLDEFQSPSTKLQYKWVSGLAQIDGTLGPVNWGFQVRVAVVPAGIVPPLSLSDYRVNSDSTSLMLTATTIQGSVVELLGCDLADGDWRVVGEQPDVDGIATFNVPIEAGVAQRFYRVRLKQ